MTGMAWGGYDLAEHAGFDGLGKGGVGAVVSGAHVTMSRCSFVSNHAALGGVFYVQGCLPERSNDAPCDEAVAPPRVGSPCMIAPRAQPRRPRWARVRHHRRRRRHRRPHLAVGCRLADGGLLTPHRATAHRARPQRLSRERTRAAFHLSDSSVTIERAHNHCDAPQPHAVDERRRLVRPPVLWPASPTWSISGCASRRGGAIYLEPRQRVAWPAGPIRTRC